MSTAEDREHVRRAQERNRMRIEAKRRLDRIRQVTMLARVLQIDAGLLLRLGESARPWRTFLALDSELLMALRSGDELALRALDVLREGHAVRHHTTRGEHVGIMTTRRRLARKEHHCEGCDASIPARHVYLEHVEFPGHDASCATHAGHPVRLCECCECAIRHGRENLLDPVPEDQPYPYWLGDLMPKDPDPFESLR